MTNTTGFYKFDGETLRFAPSSVYAPNFTLLLSLRESYSYPVMGWRYFPTLEDAESFFAINGRSNARWVEFGGAVQASQLVNGLLGAALQQLPALGLGLGVGLGKAADGDARVFLSSWAIARGRNLISAELLSEVVALAQQFGLPEEFVSALQAQAD
jgi:hypothetical protein